MFVNARNSIPYFHGRGASLDPWAAATVTITGVSKRSSPGAIERSINDRQPLISNLSLV